MAPSTIWGSSITRISSAAHQMRQPRRRLGPAVQDQRPEHHAVDRHGPVHQLVEIRRPASPGYGSAGSARNRAAPRTGRAPSAGCCRTSMARLHRPRRDHGLEEIRHAGEQHRPAHAQRDQEGARMMQHEMRPAMHEEHVLGVIVDAGLQHDPEAGHARRQNRSAATAADAGPWAGSSARGRTRPGSARWPDIPARKIPTASRPADRRERSGRRDPAPRPAAAARHTRPRLHEPSISRGDIVTAFAFKGRRARRRGRRRRGSG